MSAESFYGSSEYSTQAEELFALYVRQIEAGGAPYFEAYCAAHGEFADELIGLHTDWDNVRGLLSKLSALDPVHPGSVEPAFQAEPQTPKLSSSGAEPGLHAGPRAGRYWAGLCSLLACGAAGLGCWNYSLQLGTEVLAKERDRFELEGQDTSKQLSAAQSEGGRLQRRGDALDQALGKERSGREQLAEAHERLRQRDNKLQQEHAELSQEHRRLDTDFQALNMTSEELSRDFAAEKLAHALTSQAQRDSDQRLAFLAQLTQVEQLIRREASLWPASLSSVEALEQWVLDARALGDLRTEFEGLLKPLSTQTPALREMLARLSNLLSPGGLLERCQLRLEQLRPLREAMLDAHAMLWHETRASLADRALSPLYGGLDLPLQFGLLPLGEDPACGLWRFANLVTGEVPAVGQSGSALQYWLIPGGVQGGQICAPFLLAISAPSAAHFAHAGIGLDASTALLNSQALAKLGLCSPNQLQRDFLARTGLEPSRLAGLPVAALGL